MKHKFTTINTIVTHVHPHLDEYLAEWLLRTFGGNQVRFAHDITYGYIPTTTDAIACGYTDTVFLGVCGGPFDDHGERHQKSCTELVTEYLDIQDMPALKVLIRVVSGKDKGTRNHSSNPYTLPRMINLLHRYGLQTAVYADGDEYDSTLQLESDIRDWVFAFFGAVYCSEMQVLNQVKAQFAGMRNNEERVHLVKESFRKQVRTWVHLSIPACAKLMQEDEHLWRAFPDVVIQKQNEAFQRARAVAESLIEVVETARFGCVRTLMIDGSGGEYSSCEIEFDVACRSAGADLVLVRNSVGNTFLCANNKFLGNLQDLIIAIRQEESKKRGITLSPEQLSAQGTVSALPQWHVHEMIEPEARFRRIYNGSITRPDVEPTILSFGELRTLVQGFLTQGVPIPSQAFLTSIGVRMSA